MSVIPRATVDLVDPDGDTRTVTIELGELPPP